MAGQHRLHLGGINLEAAAIDHVLLPVEHAYEILFIDRAEIAGMPEAAGKVFRGGLRIVPVPLDNGAAVGPDFADLAARYFPLFAVDDHNGSGRELQANGIAMPPGKYLGNYGPWWVRDDHRKARRTVR